MAVVVAAVDGLIECTTCFLRQQVWSEEKMISVPVTKVLTDSLFFSLFLTLPALPPKWSEVAIFPYSFVSLALV